MAGLYRRGAPPRPGEKVLLWVPGGMPIMLQVEGVIAAALKLRGIDVHAVICDGPFIGCVRRELGDDVPVARWHEACGACKAATSEVLDFIGIPYSFIGDFVSPETRSTLRRQASTVSWDNLDTLDLASTVRSSVVRFLKGASISGHEEIVPEYAYSALVCASAAEVAIRELQPTRVFMSHGVYVDWGPALFAALGNGVPVSAWMASYLDAHFYFRHIEDPLRIDFHNMSGEAWREQSSLPMTAAKEAALTSYSANRYHKKVSFDMKHLEDFSGDTRALRERYVRRPDRPTWGIMAHINWDSVCDYAPMAYDLFDDWIVDTIEQAIRIEDVNWLLKVHPAEAWDNPESGVQRLVEERFPDLPPHVRVIPAQERISPLDFYQLVDGGVTVYGTAGLEMALLGKPVILAGEAHYGGKGFTYDGLTKHSYRDLLVKARGLGPLSSEQRLLAKKYAHAYFIRRQIPLPAVRDPKGWWKFQLDERDTLLPGKNAFVDFVCERILDGGDFLMGDDLVASALAMSSAQDTPADLLIAVT
jgi:capsular polysaccharide biosynthesis protein